MGFGGDQTRGNGWYGSREILFNDLMTRCMAVHCSMAHCFIASLLSWFLRVG